MTKVDWIPIGRCCVQDRSGIRGDSAEGVALPFVGLEHIAAHSGRISISHDSVGKSVGTNFLFDERHVLYGKLRPYLNKVALPDFSGRCSTELIPLLPREGVDREYLAFALRSPRVVSFATKHSAGSRMPRAKLKNLFQLKIPLPPLSEQRQIIARLRQELQDSDKINRVVESEFEKTRQISVALLRDAFRKMKINRCPFVALAKIIAEATSGFACGQRDPKGIVQVRMHNISNEFALVWETVTRIPKRALDPKHYFLPGDIVFNNTNSAALVGKSALFVGGKEPIVFSNHMTRLRVDREICLPEFLLLYLRDQWNQGLFSRICARWVGQSAVRSAKLMQLSIPLPPMAEQRRIVNFLHAQLEDIAKISAAVERQLESARALPQAVLRRAFS